MSTADYTRIFETEKTESSQAALYFKDDKTAESAISSLPDGFMGTLSTSEVYVQNVGDVFSQNVLYYIALIAVCILFAALISVIFGRSVKIYQTDFAVYRTLGISNKVSSRSLYVQMALIFLPTLVLLPIVSLIAAVIPGSSMAFITVGNYFFIEIMMLLMVELVAFGFNRNISGQSIRKSLRRGTLKNKFGEIYIYYVPYYSVNRNLQYSVTDEAGGVYAEGTEGSSATVVEAEADYAVFVQSGEVGAYIGKSFYMDINGTVISLGFSECNVCTKDYRVQYGSGGVKRHRRRLRPY